MLARARCDAGDNDSPFLLDKHRRGLQNLDRMARYARDDAGRPASSSAPAPAGVTLAQRLARSGWRIVVLEKGPFWDPDRDWVSDEKGAGPIYWTDNRIIGGTDPIEMGKNNSGVGVGGSMTHFAGYTPRFHPSDFEVRTRDGVAVDWPISYWDLKASFERVERELPVAGQHWPWGDPHDYPHAPHPSRGAAVKAWQGARDCGIEMRVGPVSITNGVVRQPAALHLPRLLPPGLQGEREGVAADHAPARRDRARRRGARRLDGDAHRGRRRGGRVTGVTYVARRPRALPAGGRRRRLRLRDRVAAAAAELDRSASRTGSPTTTTRSAAT